MTTDNHTPDPAPALLPPAHLAEIRERADAPLRPMPDAEERAAYFGQAIADRAALLAHLDALHVGPVEVRCTETGVVYYVNRAADGTVTVSPRDMCAPSPSFADASKAERGTMLRAAFDQGRAAERASLRAGPLEDVGEALGRGLFDHLSAMAWPNGRGEMGGPGWDGMREDSRSFYRAAALALYTHGYAAGRSEGEAERARLLSELADLRAKGEADREVSNYREAEIARLTVERDALAAELARWCKGAGVTSPDALASLLRDNLRAIDAARVEGARAEREAVDLYLLAAYQETGYEGPVASALSDALDWLRARGAGGAR